MWFNWFEAAARYKEPTMPAPLFQIAVTRDEQPITSLVEAVDALAKLRIEFDAIEVEDAESGVYLVGLLGPMGDQAWRGDDVTIAEGDLVFTVPQP